MSSSFLDDIFVLVKQSLSSVDPYKTETIKTRLAEIDGHPKDFLLPSLLHDLGQGDIISSVPFVFLGEDGATGELKEMDAIVLSNTCDCQRDDTILIAPMVKPQKPIPCANSHYEFFQIPEGSISEEIADFSKSQPIKRNVLSTRLVEQKSMRKYSLSLLDFYMFYLKMTVFLFRPEDKEYNESRNLNSQTIKSPS